MFQPLISSPAPTLCTLYKTTTLSTQVYMDDPHFKLIEQDTIWGNIAYDGNGMIFFVDL